MDFDQLAEVVAAQVQISALADGVPFEFDAQNRTWKREALVLKLSEHNGAALVSYVKAPTEVLGHSSSAMQFRISMDGAHSAGAFILDCLSNPYRYS